MVLAAMKIKYRVIKIPKALTFIDFGMSVGVKIDDFSIKLVVT